MFVSRLGSTGYGYGSRRCHFACAAGWSVLGWGWWLCLASSLVTRSGGGCGSGFDSSCGLGVDANNVKEKVPMVKRDVCFSVDDGARLVGRLIDVAFAPGRFTNIELSGLLDSFNDLLTSCPEVHSLDPRVFGFHQALIVEHERRAELVPDGWIPGQLEFGDIAPGVFGVEVGY